MCQDRGTGVSDYCYNTLYGFLFRSNAKTAHYRNAKPINLRTTGAKRALERLDAFLEEMDDEGRMISYGKVAAVAVVGNHDGAHHVLAEIDQALNHVGFTTPANAIAYWIKDAVGSTNFVNLRGAKSNDDQVNTR